MSKSIFNRRKRATRAHDLFTARRRRRVSFERAVAKVKPSRTRRPRQEAQLVPVRFADRRFPTVSDPSGTLRTHLGPAKDPCW